MENTSDSAPKVTRLGVRSDLPTAISSSMHGSNIDALGFNLIFIALRNPKLAVELLKLYEQAHTIREDDPKAPQEDFALFADALAQLMKDKLDA